MSLGEVELSTGGLAALGGVGSTVLMIGAAFAQKRPVSRAALGTVLATFIGAGALKDSASRITNEYEASLMPAVLSQLDTSSVPASQIETMKNRLGDFCGSNKLQCPLEGKPLQDSYRAVDETVRAASPTSPGLHKNWIEKLGDDHSGLRIYSSKDDHTTPKYTITIGEVKGPKITRSP